MGVHRTHAVRVSKHIAIDVINEVTTVFSGGAPYIVRTYLGKVVSFSEKLFLEKKLLFGCMRCLL